MINCIVVDDQKESVDLLTDHIKLIPALNLKLATNDSISALNFLDKEKVDLVFLDVQMPGLSGIDIMDTLKERYGNEMPKIILTTGYDEYALAGYEYGVSDYLLKPISFKRFKISIDRIINDVEKKPSERNEFIFVERDGLKEKINFSEVVFIEGARNYIFIVTLNDKIIIYKSLSSILKLLPEKNFIRVHKSFIVGVDKIQTIRGNEISVKLNNGTKKIPIGVTYRESVFMKLNISQ
jgi:DNA-binding LytR/AlgR family response regulator